jgi:hypothetical protein
MEDLGKVRYALGIRITQSPEKISLIQDKYIGNILSKFQIANHRNTLTPLPSNWNSEKNKPSKILEPPPFSY